MKRAIAHILTATITLVILCLRLKAATSFVLLMWYTPTIIAQSSVIVLLLVNLKYKPVHSNEKLTVFFAALLSTNFPVLISLLGLLYPQYQAIPISGLQIAGSLLNLLSMPLYSWALLNLGQNLAILPEAYTLRVNGAYRFSRHPLYLIYIFWCVTQCMIFQTWSTLVFSIPQTTLYLFRAKQEEKVLSDVFPEYLEYRKKVMWLGARKEPAAISV